MSKQPDWLESLKADAQTLSLGEVEDALEPVGGLKILGTLTDEERLAYSAVYNMELDLQSVQEELFKRHIQRSADTLIENFETLTLQGVMELGARSTLFDNVTEARDFFYRVAQFEYKNKEFWFGVRSTRELWVEYLAIRKGWRVVTTGLKYRQ